MATKLDSIIIEQGGEALFLCTNHPFSTSHKTSLPQAMPCYSGVTVNHVVSTTVKTFAVIFQAVYFPIVPQRDKSFGIISLRALHMQAITTIRCNNSITLYF